MTILDNSSEQETVPEPWQCVGCDHNYSPDDEVSWQSGRGPLCNDCHFICDNCSNNFNINSGSPHAALNNGDTMCYQCTREYYFLCSDCDEWEHRDSGLSNDRDETVCEPCYENYYWYCDDCNRTVSERRGHDCESPHSDHVRGYHDRPQLQFYHTAEEYDNAKVILKDSNDFIRRYRQIAYLGFELEVECTDGATAYRQGAEMLSECPQLYMNQDGSIRYGFEIISHPMTLDWAMSSFDWEQFTKLRDMGFSAWTEDTVGIHVHVSRDGFSSDTHQMKFAHFIMRNEEFLTWLVGRPSTHYSQFSRRHLRRMTKDKLYGREGSERYMAVNFNNSKTIEVRMFQSSLKPDRIKMSLQLIDAILKYSEPLTTYQITRENAFSHDNFMTWVSEHSDRYPQLADYTKDWSSAKEYEKEHGYKARIGE